MIFGWEMRPAAIGPPTSQLREFYLKSNVGSSYKVTTATANGSATIQANVTWMATPASSGVAGVGELNFTNPHVITHVLDNYVANWLASNPLPGSMLSLSPADGGAYDESASTECLGRKLQQSLHLLGWL